MKAAAILAAIDRHNAVLKGGMAAHNGSSPEMIDYVLVHTGQHYDELMSGSFFADLNLTQPKMNLEATGGSHAQQTAQIMVKFEAVLQAEMPDIVVVVGDVNSTLACSLTAAKISYNSNGSRPLIAHVEAGLRSFDRSMPEEINRIVTDHVSDLLFVTEKSGLDNLRAEGIPPAKIHFSGNTMVDTLLSFSEKAESSSILGRLGLLSNVKNGGCSKAVREYALLTLHRPSNVDNREIFQSIIEGLRNFAVNRPIVFPVHPRTQHRMREFGLELRQESGFFLIEPLGYLDFLCLMKKASLVVTDSGGIQEETTCLGVPCVTVRENTERPVTLVCGTNVIAGTESSRIANAVREQLGRKFQDRRPPHWDGRAARRIVEILVRSHPKGVRLPGVLLAQPTA